MGFSGKTFQHCLQNSQMNLVCCISRLTTALISHKWWLHDASSQKGTKLFASIFFLLLIKTCWHIIMTNQHIIFDKSSLKPTRQLFINQKAQLGCISPSSCHAFLRSISSIKTSCELSMSRLDLRQIQSIIKPQLSSRDIRPPSSTWPKLFCSTALVEAFCFSGTNDCFCYHFICVCLSTGNDVRVRTLRGVILVCKCQGANE